MNMVTYWVTTGSPPWASTESVLTVNRVPVEPTCTLKGCAVVAMDRPGTSGWWKCMSCSPCTIIIAASGGTTSMTATSITSQVGTTANTGGAYLPDV